MPSSIVLHGTLEIGGFVKIINGATLSVQPNAILTFKGNTFLNFNSIIFVRNKLEIGKEMLCAWNCTFTDSNHHYIIYGDETIANHTKPVKIGDCCWIGAGSTIGRGAILTSNTVVGANSYVNKDYTQEGSNILLAGTPAKTIKRDCYRLNEYVSENKTLFNDVNKFFTENPESDKYIINK